MAEREAEAPLGLKAQRAEETRATLISAARKLFGEKGYANVGTEEIVRDAGVTRGALYHHFGGKKELLDAVYVEIEAELRDRVGSAALAAAPTSPLEAMRVGTRIFLEACLEPEVQQIGFLDSPSVLGWERWHEIAEASSLGLVSALVTEAINQGEIDPVPIRPMVYVLGGAIDEGAMYVARSDEPEKALEEVVATLDRLLEGLRPTA